jgi:ADP-heptose:LPS heptosyltransferase
MVSFLFKSNVFRTATLGSRESHRTKLKKTPEKILVIKAHSAGIGDILRSSAAWRALRNAFPGVQLHLLFLSKEPGYASESLMSRHHLLDGFCVVDKRTKGAVGWRTFLGRIEETVKRMRPDLIVDAEPHGLRTSLVSLWLRLRLGVRTVGIGEVPFRGLFYGAASVSSRKFARQRGLDFPLEYTNRDFVSLSALGIERGGIPIELEETAEGASFRSEFREKFGIPADARILGVNIGCGTPDALHKRPDLPLLSAIVGNLQKKYGFCVVLTGAAFEKDVNMQFIKMHAENYPHHLFDLAGETGLPELTGLIRSCTFFISTDSGPYHMAVALRVPTLAIFTTENRVHFHHEPWVRCVMLARGEDVTPAIRAADEIIGPSRMSVAVP